MAVEKRNSLGEITGMLGDVVRRKRHGKIIISMRPSKYRKSKSKQAVEGRSSFALSVALAKAVNNIPQLKQVWQHAKLDGVIAYNRVIKYNKQFIKNNALTPQNIITPKGIPLSQYEFKLKKNAILLNIDTRMNELKRLFKNSFYIHTIIYAFAPVSSKSKPFIISYQSIEVEQTSVDGVYNLEIKFNSANQQLITKYKSFIVYTAVTNFKGNKNEVYWTSTVTKQFEI